jgi:8-oxo-dGTP pyrophosphatase MutT (NUDIX family)
MSEPEPLTPRPAATVMLVRDVRRGTARDLEVFLMRRHSAMEFVAGVMVFPGGGVDDRDRGAFTPGRSAPAPEEAPVAWYGPEPSWWAERLGVDVDLAEALVCAAARETFEESGVLFAGPASSPDGENKIVADASVYRDARKALDAKSLSFGEFLRDEKLVLRADLLRPWANWVTPKEERTRRYDTYFFVGALPEGQRADGDNTETDRAGWATPQSALDEFAEGRSFLLPPTWTQLDSLNGRTVGEVLAVDRKIVAIEPHLAVSEGNWEIEFFNSERYNEARNRRSPEGRSEATGESAPEGRSEATGESKSE